MKAIRSGGDWTFEEKHVLLDNIKNNVLFLTVTRTKKGSELSV